MPLSLGITPHYTLGLIHHNKKTRQKNITFKISYPCNHKQKKLTPLPEMPAEAWPFRSKHLPTGYHEENWKINLIGLDN